MPTKKRQSAERYVVVRTYSAGAHCGRLVERTGREVVLAEARRIWQWSGAYTLHEVAAAGVSAESKISCVVPTIVLTEAIEVIDCTDMGRASLEGAKWME